MDETTSAKLPLERHGRDWTPFEIESAKDWFAQNLLSSALSVAMIQLTVRGFPRLELAEDSVSEWLCGRVDKGEQLLPSRFGRAIKGYDPERGALRTFLFEDLRLYVSGTIIRRLVIESRLDPIDSIVIEDPRSNLSFLVSVRDLTRLVMDALDEKERRILTQNSAGHTIEEIASTMQCSKSAVKTAISRARSHAREELDRLGHSQRGTL